MNRIILIGNGFDLAHNMKTSYSHFIDDYWESVINEIQNQPPLSKYVNSEIEISKTPQSLSEIKTYDTLIKTLKNHNSEIWFKNKFLQVLMVYKDTQNWVDIEKQYYQLLKNSFNNSKTTYKIEQLNKDFNSIKELLEKYLLKIEKEFDISLRENNTLNRIINNIGGKVFSDFNLNDFTEDEINSRLEIEYRTLKKNSEALRNGYIELNDLNQKQKILISRIESVTDVNELRGLLLSTSSNQYFDLDIDNLLFLNFNYTYTEKLYSNNNFNFSNKKSIEKKYIHIHGTLDEKDENSIIFGFGDELDDDYKVIEKLDDNEYLENIKSIKYLENDNYKKLLEYLNSDKYQIFIFGHSCGNSDRTLLNTLFEHKNCVSVKPFYYQKSQEEDNYSDLVKNISRNFNNKVIMRDKVVNKKYCQPLS